jgi:nitrate reductase (NAD(P)H)
MSLEFSRLSPDEEVELKGPIGDFIWKGDNTASVYGEDRQVRELGLICGGSGVAPILQVARGILVDTSNNTKVWILDSNKTEDDILCREELDWLGKEFKDRCKVHYTLTRESIPNGWAYSKGRIDKIMIDCHLPSPDPGHLIGICGPKLMEERVKGMSRRYLEISRCSLLIGLLQDKGWKSKEVITF